MNTRFEEVYAAEADRLQAYVARRVPDSQEAQDIVQDVWMALYEALEAGRPMSNAAAWLYTVARNAIIDHFRKQKTRQNYASTLPGEPSEHLQRLPSMNDERIWEEIQAGLEQLSPKHRKAFWDTEIDEKSFKELAAETDTQLGTWLSRKYYATQKLRQILGEFYEEFLNSF